MVPLILEPQEKTLLIIANVTSLVVTIVSVVVTVMTAD